MTQIYKPISYVKEKSLTYLNVYSFLVNKMNIFNFVKKIFMDQFLAKTRNS